MFLLALKLRLFLLIVPMKKVGSSWKLASEELKREATRLTGIIVKHAKFVTDSAAVIYIDDSAIGSMIGPGGEGIRRLEQDLGLKLDVHSIQELPRGLRKKLQKSSESNFDPSSWTNRSGRNWEYNSGKSKRSKGRKGRR